MGDANFCGIWNFVLKRHWNCICIIFWRNKIFFEFSIIHFLMLREVYTMGCLQDSSDSKRCREIKKKREEKTIA